MRAHHQAENTATLAQYVDLMKIGELLRAEYSAVEAPLPERLATLLGQLKPLASSGLRPTCPKCRSTMERTVHAPRLGGHPALGGYACPRCRYIARDVTKTH
jgi:hypothetical protein